jgi:hypothetical protein
MWYLVMRTDFFTLWFQRECGKDLLSIAIMGHVFEVRGENDMQAEFPMINNGGLSLCGDEELAW